MAAISALDARRFDCPRLPRCGRSQGVIAPRNDRDAGDLESTRRPPATDELPGEITPAHFRSCWLLAVRRLSLPPVAQRWPTFRRRYQPRARLPRSGSAAPKGELRQLLRRPEATMRISARPRIAVSGSSGCPRMAEEARKCPVRRRGQNPFTCQTAGIGFSRSLRF